MKPTHLKAIPCPGHGSEQFGDTREGTCATCGRQVKGYTDSSKGKSYGLRSVDQSTFAQSRRKFRPAA